LYMNTERHAQDVGALAYSPLQQCLSLEKKIYALIAKDSEKLPHIFT
jgi:hypothetical protein